ncbi:MAG: potassium-transporting ATPase subunit KdpA [Anaerolineales bacterium]|jgi:K+-transporting ATPase ATPase A chain
MNLADFLQLGLFLVVLFALAAPLGAYMAHVYEGKRTFLDPILGPVERLLYRASGVRTDAEMDWKVYAIAVLLFNLLALLVVYGIQRLQGVLPLNPQGLPGVPPDLSWNTAVSFATNTNWQAYGGETTMSYLTQMLALAVQNFMSAAAGMAILVALIRALVRNSAKTIGNFWVDLVRGTLYVLLPLSFLLALALVSQGVVQSFGPYRQVPLLQPVSYQQPKVDANGNAVLGANGQPETVTQEATSQLLPLGPAASQIAIKQLGSNGGGFFNVNSAHPFENPTPFSNFLEVLAIILIPVSLCFTFGRMVGDRREGWAISAAMAFILVTLLAVAVWSEQAGNPILSSLGVDQRASAYQSGGNMEGKEVRFGSVNSALWATITTAVSNGSVNSMHDSFMPLGGLVPMWMMQLGEIIYGGVGSGLYGMLAFVIVAVFVAGLMVGRTPEYLGKKIEAFEMKMASLMVLTPVVVVLAGTAVAVAVPAGRAGAFNPGPHGFSEILYAFSSTANNNGSAFAGLGADTFFYNVSTGFAMLMGRYWLKVFALALAGSLVQKKKVPPSAGTLPTHTPLFVAWLVAVVVIVAALSFIPALALGPIVEHLMIFG